MFLELGLVVPIGHFLAFYVVFFPLEYISSIFSKNLISASLVDIRRHEAEMNFGRVASRLRGFEAS